MHWTNQTDTTHLLRTGAGVVGIADAQGTFVGRLDINGIDSGALPRATIGYWVGAHGNRLGLASTAVAEAIVIANSLGLQRLHSETQFHNKSSQRVLEKNGFTQYELAPKYLKIPDTCEDHLLFLTPHQINAGLVRV